MALTTARSDLEESAWTSDNAATEAPCADMSAAAESMIICHDLLFGKVLQQTHSHRALHASRVRHADTMENDEVRGIRKQETVKGIGSS